MTSALLAIVLLALAVSLALSRTGVLDWFEDASEPAGIPEDATRATLLRVIDGDTIAVQTGGGEETVRLIGIDAPETTAFAGGIECFGPEAADALNIYLPGGTTLWLERDVSDRDRFGRLLRFVWVEKPREGAVLVNEWLVLNGLASARVYPPDDEHASLLARSEEEARKARAGMWGACDMSEFAVAPGVRGAARALSGGQAVPRRSP
jgi:micrococcal nuclease